MSIFRKSVKFCLALQIWLFFIPNIKSVFNPEMKTKNAIGSGDANRTWSNPENVEDFIF